jgi:hypothetical protein
MKCMRGTAHRTIALAGMALVVSGAVPAPVAAPPASASRPPQVLVGRVTR